MKVFYYSHVFTFRDFYNTNTHRRTNANVHVCKHTTAKVLEFYGVNFDVHLNFSFIKMLIR